MYNVIGISTFLISTSGFLLQGWLTKTACSALITDKPWKKVWFFWMTLNYIL